MADQAGFEIGLLLGGDVMLGRGIDQLLPHPGNPTLYEHWRQIYDARKFVQFAERKHGAIPDRRDIGYVWGNVLPEIETLAPDLRLINLETSVTAQGQPWPNKRIHYRMHPLNIEVLTHARIDFCALANNHILDWGYPGLEETIYTLEHVGIRHAGAGKNLQQAGAPAILEVSDKGRVIVVSIATTTSGTPIYWGAGANRPGINLIDLDDIWLNYVRSRIDAVKQVNDIAIASIHWGGNFGYGQPISQREFARRLIAEARIDLVHGHSSHHVKGIELYQEKLILYGCGDLINDYEGIPKSPQRQAFEPDLGLLYFAKISTSNGKLNSLQMFPTRMRQLRLQRATADDAERLSAILNREGSKLGTRVTNENGTLNLCV